MAQQVTTGSCRHILLCLMFGIVPLILSQPTTQSDKRCVDTAKYRCYEDNVCAYTFLIPRPEDGTPCEPLHGTVTELHGMSEHVEQLDVLQGQLLERIQRLENGGQTPTRASTMSAPSGSAATRAPVTTAEPPSPPLRHLTTFLPSNVHILDIAVFTDNGATYLIICLENYFYVYTISAGGEYSLIQSYFLSVDFERQLEYLGIGEDHFLAVSTCPTFGKMCIFKWDKTDSEFTDYQELDIYVRRGYCFTGAVTVADGVQYYLVPNGVDYAAVENTVTIQRWDGSQFIHFQDLENTAKTEDCTIMNVANELYLTITSSYSEHAVPTYNVPSLVYKLKDDGSAFEVYQTLPISGESSSVLSFTYRDQSFLLDVINRGADGSQNPTQSPLYVWGSDSTPIYTVHKTFTGNYGKHGCQFSSNNLIYLVVRDLLYVGDHTFSFSQTQELNYNGLEWGDNLCVSFEIDSNVYVVIHGKIFILQ